MFSLPIGGILFSDAPFDNKISLGNYIVIEGLQQLPFNLLKFSFNNESVHYESSCLRERG